MSPNEPTDRTGEDGALAGTDESTVRTYLNTLADLDLLRRSRFDREVEGPCEAFGGS